MFIKKKVISWCFLTVFCLSLTTSFSFAKEATKTNQDLPSTKKMTIEELQQYENEKAQLAEKSKKVQEKISEQGVVKDPKSNGDIQAKYEDGTYPTRAGVILVTKDSQTSGIAHGHAGIIWSSAYTVESFTSGGVQRRSNDWNTRYKTVYGETVSSTTATQDNDASNWCNAQIGKSYNFNFVYTSTRNSFYCSQLPWASFKDKFSINIDDDGGIVWPVDLIYSSKTITIYYKA